MQITKTGLNLPSRVILHGVEGIGKTSFGAYAPSPVFSMTKGETGLLTLIDNGMIEETPHFDEVITWVDLLRQILYLTENDVGYRTYVIDTLNGAERLCFEYVVGELFGGSWEKFSAYGKGPDIALAEWIKFLEMLDRLRSKRRMAIMTLCHTKVKTFRNPEGDDYDRYTPDMHDKVWGLSHKWADVVLFANFEIFAKKDKGSLKAKAVGGQNRILYTQRTAAYDAKNRIGLPFEISLGVNAYEGWMNFQKLIKEAKARKQSESVSPISSEQEG